MMPIWPLWQKVSLLSSPVWMLVTQMSWLLMKLMKSGSTGQILASIRVPQHWLLISTGCTGKVCSARDNEERYFLLEEICCSTLETDGSRRKWLLKIWKQDVYSYSWKLQRLLFNVFTVPTKTLIMTLCELWWNLCYKFHQSSYFARSKYIFCKKQTKLLISVDVYANGYIM